MTQDTVIVETLQPCSGYKTKFRHRYSLPAGVVEEVPRADAERWVSHKHAEILGKDGPSRLKAYRKEGDAKPTRKARPTSKPTAAERTTPDAPPDAGSEE